MLLSKYLPESLLFWYASKEVCIKHYGLLNICNNIMPLCLKRTLYEHACKNSVLSLKSSYKIVIKMVVIMLS